MDRGLINRILSRLPVVLAGLALADSALLEHRCLRVNRVSVPSGSSFPSLAGVRLAHFSDLHVGGRGWRRGTIEAAIDAVNGEDVDLIAVTGDFLGSGAGALAAVEILGRLRRDIPRYAVLGNHDHVYGIRPLGFLSNGLGELGITVLRNSAELVDLHGNPIWVAGVDDGYSMRDDLDSVLACLRTVQSPAILLTHYPEVAGQLKPHQVQLSLAGHSHGGQIRLPVIAEMVHRAHARTRYGKGLFFVNGNPLYVTSGVGTSGVPLRFLNLPEVAVISFASGRPPSGRMSCRSASRSCGVFGHTPWVAPAG